MSRNVTVAIFGNGKTTRSNVEALIGDFKDAVDSLDIVISGAYVGDGGVWVLQYAEAQEIPLKECEDPFAVIEAIEDKSSVKFFLLWDDEDPVCQEVATFAKAHAIQMYDLTDGLIRISTSANPAPVADTQPKAEAKEEPLFEAEPAEKPNFGWEFTQKSTATATAAPATTVPTPAPAESLGLDEDEDYDYDDDYEDDEDEFGFLNSGDLIVTALEEAGRIFASAFVEEMLRLLRQDGDDKAK